MPPLCSGENSTVQSVNEIRTPSSMHRAGADDAPIGHDVEKGAHVVQVGGALRAEAALLAPADAKVLLEERKLPVAHRGSANGRVGLLRQRRRRRSPVPYRKAPFKDNGIVHDGNKSGNHCLCSSEVPASFWRRRLFWDPRLMRTLVKLAAERVEPRRPHSFPAREPMGGAAKRLRRDEHRSRSRPFLRTRDEARRPPARERAS